MATFTFMIMAKINNAQIIQKLIDELKLYPGTDLIPTELAEKILPVFLINDQTINFSETGQIRYMKQQTAGNVKQTLTVPVGKKWRVDLFSWKMVTDITVDSRVPRLQINDADGNLIMEGRNLDGASHVNQTASLTLQYILGITANDDMDTFFSRDENDAVITRIFRLPIFTRNLILLPGWTINVGFGFGLAQGQVGDTVDTFVIVNESDDDSSD